MVKQMAAKPDRWKLLACIWLSFAPAVLCAQPTPMPQAHAHNDYLHDRPLLDAVSYGFCSVEADVFLVDGDLLVAHTFLELGQAKSLRELYLDPLKELVEKQSGSVYGDGQTFTLLIDIKTRGEQVYPVLDRMLADYPSLFSMVRTDTDGKREVEPGPVTVIVSGDRPFELVASDTSRFVGIDGRLSDLNEELDRKWPPDLMPLISDNWNSHFQWRGTGELSPEEQQKLQSFVDRAHAAHRRIRFWAIPDNAASWAVMKQAGVDLINTDKLAELSEFCKQ